jgi:hypothetical protein
VPQDRSVQFGQRKFQALGACAAALVVTFAADVALAEQSGLGSAGARGARWKQNTVTVSVEDSVDVLGTEGAAFEAVIRAATAWQNAPGILPTLVVQRGPDDPVGYRRNGKNKNTVRFAPDGDPLANGALAITVITFDAHAKEILDADVVLNGEHGFSFFDHDARDETLSPPTYDLQNVLTHELGHLLGLGEDMKDVEATMYAFSQPGETGKRDLEVVDKDSIAALYSEEFDSELQGGCGGAAIAGYQGEAWMWAALGFGALGFAMRRRAIRHAGLSATALGALVLFAGAGDSLPASESLAFTAGDALPMTVLRADSSWEDGVIVTRLGLHGVDAENVSHDVTVKALGGRVGDLVQVVGHALPPGIGDSLRLKLGTSVLGEPIWVAPISEH